MIPPGVPESSLKAIVRKAYWRAEDAGVVLAAWGESGLSLTAFARRHGVARGRLAHWRPRIRQAPRFHPVRVVGQPGPGTVSTPIEVIAGSRRVVVPAGFDAGHLRSVLRALEEPGC